MNHSDPILPPTVRRSLRKEWLLAIAMFVATMLVYIPSMRNGFIWDDDGHVENNRTLLTNEGFTQIWTKLGATQQYYPLVFSTFWLEHHFWGNKPTGYHIDNIVLHALSAIALWRLLKRLRLRWSWMIALVFAIHPVNVESVAWVSERKNVLSGLLALLSATFYLRYAAPEWWDHQPQNATGDRHGRWWNYGLALLMFILALFAKTVVCTVPIALLLIIWWRRNRLTVIDCLRALPLLVAGLGMGYVTAFMEKTQIGALGAAFNLSPADRVLIAGRAVWFYASKLLWPMRLTFIYPRWSIDSHQLWQWLFPLAAIAVIATIWCFRKRIGRGPLVALLYFGGTLVPALGFVNVYPMRYSFVADHFQYLATIGIIAVVISIIATFVRNERATVAIFAALIATLAIITMRQQSMYRDRETLWLATIERNPAATIAFTNLASVYFDRHEWPQSIAMNHRALQLDPDEKVIHYNLGLGYAELNESDLSIAEFERAIALDPNYMLAHDHLGLEYEHVGRGVEAETQYRLAILVARNDPAPYVHYAHRRANAGAFESAIDLLRHANAVTPSARIHFELAALLGRDGRQDEAIAQLRAALKLQPDFKPARDMLLRLGQSIQ